MESISFHVFLAVKSYTHFIAKQKQHVESITYKNISVLRFYKSMHGHLNVKRGVSFISYILQKIKNKNIWLCRNICAVMRI